MNHLASVRPPDLQILVRQSHARELDFEVRSDLLGFLGKHFGHLRLTGDSRSIAQYEVRSRLNAIFDSGHQDEYSHDRAQQQLASLGTALFGMLPAELRRLLWSMQGQIKTIQIVSDEPYLMWELFKLQDEDGEEGPFLCEAFVVTRWLRELPQSPQEFSLQKVALVRPKDSSLPGSAGEKEDLHSLMGLAGAIEIAPTFLSVMDALDQGEFDGWHFIGHMVGEGDVGAGKFLLEEDQWLAPEHFSMAKRNLRRCRPLFFLNACNSGRVPLTALGGWAQRTLAAGAGAFLGILHEVRDKEARAFAYAFYQHFFAGLPIGEAVRQARLQIREQFPGSPAWLAYTLYAHPEAIHSRSPQISGHRDPLLFSLHIPDLRWRPEISPPAALLRAEYGIVPFHGRGKEISELYTWCTDNAPLRIRLYTGPGGIGKTRLALETAKTLRHEGWIAGLLQPKVEVISQETWTVLSRPGGRVFAIVDYAETQQNRLVSLLRHLYSHHTGPIRLILLARAALDWWEQLKVEGEGVGDLVSGPATTQHSLQPLAISSQERAESFHLAEMAFAQKLSVACTAETPEDLGASYYERVLLLHMSALATVQGEAAKGENGVLDHVLEREWQYLRGRILDHQLARSLVPGLRRAMAAITLGGGVENEAEAVAVLRSLRAFDGHTGDVLLEVAHLLHESYPGNRWIEPILPGLLGEHLIQRELERGAADELFSLVLGQTAEDSA